MTNGRSSWLKLPLLLSLLLLVPRVGLAAQDTPPTDSSTESRIPGTEESESRRLVDEESWSREQRTGAPQGLRILGEFGAGTVTAVGGVIGGGLVGLGLCGVTGGQAAYIGCLGGAILGAGLGGALGYPLGVWWGGEALGGDGSLFAAIGGMGGGILAAVVLGLVTTPLDPSGALTGVTTGLVLLGGPILAYELTQRGDSRQPRRGPALASSRPRIQPLLSVSSRGAVLGLGGSF
ncbi:hypothetical protein [Archangium sp.]|uniref:hypothetical protein n=1 Tax=Archangium sp. TaxID=1872627 RepID=UPI00286BCEE3|nr:hypothetical protein [Archangium sp.]